MIIIIMYVVMWMVFTDQCHQHWLQLLVDTANSYITIYICIYAGYFSIMKN